MGKDVGKGKEKGASERRQASRADVELVIEYSDLEHFCQDYARNLSLGGIFIETRSPLPLGAELQLSFALPGYRGKIRSSGKVVRRHTVEDAEARNLRPGMAVQFDDLSEDNKSIIDALVQLVPGLKKPLSFFSNAVTLVFSGMMIYYGWQMAELQARTNQKTIIMQIPLVYLYAILPLMGVLMLIRTLHVMHKDLGNKKA